MTIDHLSLVGGHLCLDFMNTVGDHLTDDPGEWLETYADLVVWAQHAGAIPRDEASRLTELANRQPKAAEAAMLKARAVRETIYRLLLSQIDQQAPDAADLRAFNHVLAEAPPRSKLVFGGEGFGWQTSGSLDDVLWRVVWATADLLTSDQLAQMKICAGEGCGWLFLDTSRNHARRWCSMGDCGNRAKANRYYQRHKEK